jgi:hypothetical protein
MEAARISFHRGGLSENSLINLTLWHARRILISTLRYFGYFLKIILISALIYYSLADFLFLFSISMFPKINRGGGISGSHSTARAHGFSILFNLHDYRL